jgi:hypothetical protein
MKTIGLLGGMSWESTAVYYRLINEGVKARLGGLHSAKLVLYSVDFQEIEELQHAADWDEAGKVLAKAAHFLQLAGADIRTDIPRYNIYRRGKLESSVKEIKNLWQPDFGDSVTIKKGEISVFWACGVTPQAVVMKAKPDLCITHTPGHMFISDMLNEELATF